MVSMIKSPNPILQTSNVFMSLLLYIKTHAFVSMVTSAMIIVYLSQPIVEQGWMVKILHPPHKFERLPF
jgi:hypothetical protein